MFWLGLVVTLVGGLLSIGLSRESVKRRHHAICFPRSSYGRGLRPDLSAIAQPVDYSSDSLEH
jgi:hypothetical protein